MTRPVLAHIVGQRVYVQPLEAVEGHDALGVRDGAGTFVGLVAELTVMVGREGREHPAQRWVGIDEADRQTEPQLSKPNARDALLAMLGMHHAAPTATMEPMFEVES